MTSSTSGRPIRFFIILMMGWTTIRLLSFASWGLDAEAPPAVPVPRTASPSASPAAMAHVSMPAPRHQLQKRLGLATRMFENRSDVSTKGRPSSFTPVKAPTNFAAEAPSLIPRAATAPPGVPAMTSTPTALPPTTGNAPASRWRSSAWLLWRDGSAPPASALAAGRLGGSQAGLRIDYDLSPGSTARTFTYGRATTALNSPASPEGAVGLGWQPDRTIPVSIATERRIAFGQGARDAQAILLVGGLGPVTVAGGLEAEAYAQAGMVGLRSRDLFADGKMSLMMPVGQSPVRLGGSISGGAQPDVERLDISPELQIRLPIPKVATRLSIEWRERIAGRAAPPSGLAITVGGDF